MIIIKLFVGPSARTFNLEITSPSSGVRRHFDIPGDQVYLRAGEHINNIISTECNHFEQRLKTIRSSPQAGVDQPNQQTTKE